MIKRYLRLFRIKHYVKNLLIFTPVFFNRTLLEENHFFKTCLAFLSFSMMTSVIYIVNDLCDVEADRRHPEKCKRPLASGEISIRGAFRACACLEAASLALLLAGQPVRKAMAITMYAAYLALNWYYSVGKAKEIPILDIFILAGGFVLRVMFGAAVNGIAISNWLYLVALTGALYFGLGKRRNESGLKKDSRNVLEFYPYRFLDKYMDICLTAMLLFYSLWCNESLHDGGGMLLWSVPLLLMILMKYSLDIEKEGADGDPVETVFRDRALLLLCSIYVGVIAASVYGPSR